MKTSKLMMSVLMVALSSAGLVGCGGSSGSSNGSNSGAEVQVPTLNAQNYSISRVADDPMPDETGLEAMAMSLNGDVLVAVPVRVPDQGVGYMLRRLSGGVWQTVDQSLTGRQVQLAADPQGNFTIVDYDRLTNALRVRHLNTGSNQVVTQINQVFDHLHHVRVVQVDNKMVILTHHWQQRDCVGECSQAQVYHDVISVSTLDSSTQTSLDTQEVWSQAVDTNSTISNVALTADSQGQINVAWIARPTNQRQFQHVWVAAVHANRPATIEQVLNQQVGVSQLKLLPAGSNQILVAVQQVQTISGDPRLYVQPYTSQTVDPIGAPLITNESIEDISLAAQRLSNGAVRLVWTHNSVTTDGTKINTGELKQTLYRPNEQQFNPVTTIAGTTFQRQGLQEQLVTLSVNRLGEQISFFDENTQVARFSFNQNVNRPSLTAQRSPDLLAVLRGAPVLATAHPEGCSAALMWRQSIQTTNPDVSTASKAAPIGTNARGYYVSVLKMPEGVGSGCR